jgi:hypothetical protein
MLGEELTSGFTVVLVELCWDLNSGERGHKDRVECS